MSGDSRRVAFFARGLDGFFLFADRGGARVGSLESGVGSEAAASPPRMRAVALAREDAPEAEWVRQFLLPDEVAGYRVGPCEDTIYPTTEEILTGGDLADRLRANGVRDLLLSSALTPGIHAWSERYGVRLWAADYEQQRWLENKPLFDQFLKRHKLPRPRSYRFSAGRPFRAPRGWSSDEPVVVQRAESLGGEGTFFLQSLAEAPAWVESVRLPADEILLMREMVAGPALGITVLVTASGTRLSAVRRQCYYDERGGQRPFAGISWLPSRELSQPLQRHIDDVFLRLGRLLQDIGFRGVANCDFMVDGEQPLVIECNPRMSAATPQLFLRPELGGQPPMAEILISAWHGAENGPAANVDEQGIPNTDFAGGTLDIIPPADLAQNTVVARSIPSGVYRLANEHCEYVGPDIRTALGPDECCLISFAAAGQRVLPDTTLATVLANFQLYDEQSAMSAAGKTLLATFDYLSRP